MLLCAFPILTPALRSQGIYIFFLQKTNSVSVNHVFVRAICVYLYIFSYRTLWRVDVKARYTLSFPSPSPCKVRAFRRRFFYGLPDIFVNSRLTKGCAFGKLLYPKVRLSRINYANYGRISDHRVKILWKSNNPVNVS